MYNCPNKQCFHFNSHKHVQISSKSIGKNSFFSKKRYDKQITMLILLLIFQSLCLFLLLLGSTLGKYMYRYRYAQICRHTRMHTHQHSCIRMSTYHVSFWNIDKDAQKLVFVQFYIIFLLNNKICCSVLFKYFF